ncbi:MAG: DUF4136 domain-containing protein [Rhodospirillales bacterium]|nr:DUF4136 domain-containing protein [Rhodospirillales bacterium]
MGLLFIAVMDEMRARGRHQVTGKPRFAALCFVVIVAALAHGCGGSISTDSDYDPSVDFSRYKTYTWTSDAPLTRTGSGADILLSPLVQQRIRDAVDRTLADKGFRKDAEGDMAVAFVIGFRDYHVLHDWTPYDPFHDRHRFRRPFGTWLTEETYTRGTLAIDIFDTETKRPIWSGHATKIVGEYDGEAGRIEEIVARTIASFPPRPVP